VKVALTRWTAWESCFSFNRQVGFDPKTEWPRVFMDERDSGLYPPPALLPLSLVPSLPFPSLPFPSLPFPSLPFPSLLPFALS
jgi:hypothetical protein